MLMVEIDESKQPAKNTKAKAESNAGILELLSNATGFGHAGCRWLCRDLQSSVVSMKRNDPVIMLLSPVGIPINEQSTVKVTQIGEPTTYSFPA